MDNSNGKCSFCGHSKEQHSTRGKHGCLYMYDVYGHQFDCHCTQFFSVSVSTPSTATVATTDTPTLPPAQTEK